MKVEVGGDAIPPRGYHTAVFYDSRLWVFGGASDDMVFSELYILELGVHAYLALQPAKIA
jgi:hypothetical protein